MQTQNCYDDYSIKKTDGGEKNKKKTRRQKMTNDKPLHRARLMWSLNEALSLRHNSGQTKGKNIYGKSSTLRTKQLRDWSTLPLPILHRTSFRPLERYGKCA